MISYFCNSQAHNNTVWLDLSAVACSLQILYHSSIHAGGDISNLDALYDTTTVQTCALLNTCRRGEGKGSHAV